VNATVRLISQNRKRGLELLLLASGVLAVRCGVGLVAAATFEGIFPVLGQRVPMASFIDLDARGDRKAGYGEADKLPLAAAKATYGVTHEKDFGEVLRAKAGAAEALAGAVLTSDGGTVLRIDS
jgi:hypothetical protein